VRKQNYSPNYYIFKGAREHPSVGCGSFAPDSYRDGFERRLPEGSGQAVGHGPKAFGIGFPPWLFIIWFLV